MVGLRGKLLLIATLSGLALPASAEDGVYHGDLEAVFTPAGVLGPRWEIVEETLVPADPEQRTAGVETTRTRHYTLATPSGSRVCSVEIWAFTAVTAAKSAMPHFDAPRWRFERRGNLVVMLRGVRLEAGDFRPGLLPECRRLAELTELRAESLLD